MASYSIHKKAKAVVPVRLGEQVAQLLLERIRLGEYLPGNRLPSERELCEELGVSRTVLREGLHWLEYQKYVEILRGQHGGAVVLPTTPEVAWERVQGQVTELVELLEYRMLVEPHAAELAAGRIRSSELDQLKALHVRQLKDTGLTRPEARAIDVQMHALIADASGNRHLAQAVRDIRSHLTLGIELQSHTLTRARRSRTGHAQVIDALERHDAPAAREFMKQHIALTGESILLALREHGSVGALAGEDSAEQQAGTAGMLGTADEPVRIQAINVTDSTA